MAERQYDKTFVSTEVFPINPVTTTSEKQSTLIHPHKRIVICCDGTWQSGVSLETDKSSHSNVSRLSRQVAKFGLDVHGNIWPQLVYYDAGVGSGDITSAEAKRQGGLGIGLLDNVLEAYNFLVNNYNAGDELFFFGFSRGAYTVRATAGLVCDIGIISPYAMPGFLRKYNAWMKAKETPVDKAATAEEKKQRKSFKNYPDWVKFVNEDKPYEHGIPNVQVKVIGVWDTVGSLGVPELGKHGWLWQAKLDNYRFFNTELSDKIEHAYQALALDEKREAFSPCLWTTKSWKDKNGNYIEEGSRAKTKLVQCWFPGAHINVGGGNSGVFDEGSDREQLSAICWAWMLDRVQPHLALSEAAIDKQLTWFRRMAAGEIAPEKTEDGYIAWAYKGAKSLIWGSKNEMHPVSWALGAINNSYSGIYAWSTRESPRTPGKYPRVKDLPHGLPDHPIFCGETIHPCVYWRLSKHSGTATPYAPEALKGWEAQETTKYFRGNGDVVSAPLRKKKGWKWVRSLVTKEENDEHHIHEIMEFEVGDFPPRIIVNGAGKEEIRTRGIEQRLLEQADDETKTAWNLRRNKWREALELSGDGKA
ncbi:hypothetical protein DL95DRAFT_355235 [Leptodontidium sp. 2 PMI_412]|nr:hypothetical protein DL95DRAFT_355235 [Leptodontidium sp. 2 PMI_412]